MRPLRAGEKPFLFGLGRTRSGIRSSIPWSSRSPRRLTTFAAVRSPSQRPLHAASNLCSIRGTDLRHLITNGWLNMIRSPLFPCRILAVAVLLTAQALFAAPAKNVIVCISDGCGFNSFNAASYYEFGRLGAQVYDGPEWLKLAHHTISLNQIRSNPSSTTRPNSVGGIDPASFWDLHADVAAVRAGVGRAVQGLYAAQDQPHRLGRCRHRHGAGHQGAQRPAELCRRRPFGRPGHDQVHLRDRQVARQVGGRDHQRRLERCHTGRLRRGPQHRPRQPQGNRQRNADRGCAGCHHGRGAPGIRLERCATRAARIAL